MEPNATVTAGVPSSWSRTPSAGAVAIAVCFRLHVSVTMLSIEVDTVGGGTQMASQSACLNLLGVKIISSEVGYEKPDEKIFRADLDRISIEASKEIHVGDDTKADQVGANAVGIDCWLWGTDVKSFQDIQNRVLLPCVSYKN